MSMLFKKFGFCIPDILKKRLYHDRKFKIVINNKYIYLTGTRNSFENSLFWNSVYRSKEGFSIKILEELIRDEYKVIFWDIGANSGIYSLLVYTLKPESLIISFEPSINCRKKFSKNCEINNINLSNFSNTNFHRSGIQISDLALSSNNGNEIIKYYTDEDSFTYGGQITNLDKKIYHSEIVESVRADYLIALNSSILPNFIKIDVEGYEFEVLQGFGKYLLELKVVLIEILNDKIGKDLEQLFPPRIFRYYAVDDSSYVVEERDQLNKSPFRNWYIVRRDQVAAINYLKSQIMDSG